MDATGSLATPSNRGRPLGSPLEGPEDPSTEQRPPKTRVRRFSFCVHHVRCAILIFTHTAVHFSPAGCFTQASRLLAMPWRLQGVLPPVRVRSYL